MRWRIVGVFAVFGATIVTTFSDQFIQSLVRTQPHALIDSTDSLIDRAIAIASQGVVAPIVPELTRAEAELLTEICFAHAVVAKSGSSQSLKGSPLFIDFREPSVASLRESHQALWRETDKFPNAPYSSTYGTAELPLDNHAAELETRICRSLALRTQLKLINIKANIETLRDNLLDCMIPIVGDRLGIDALQLAPESDIKTLLGNIELAVGQLKALTESSNSMEAEFVIAELQDWRKRIQSYMDSNRIDLLNRNRSTWAFDRQQLHSLLVRHKALTSQRSANILDAYNSKLPLIANVSTENKLIESGVGNSHSYSRRVVRSVLAYLHDEEMWMKEEAALRSEFAKWYCHHLNDSSGLAVTTYDQWRAAVLDPADLAVLKSFLFVVSSSIQAPDDDSSRSRWATMTSREQAFVAQLSSQLNDELRSRLATNQLDRRFVPTSSPKPAEMLYEAIGLEPADYHAVPGIAPPEIPPTTTVEVACMIHIAKDRYQSFDELPDKVATFIENHSRDVLEENGQRLSVLFESYDLLGEHAFNHADEWASITDNLDQGIGEFERFTNTLLAFGPLVPAQTQQTIEQWKELLPSSQRNTNDSDLSWPAYSLTKPLLERTCLAAERSFGILDESIISSAKTTNALHQEEFKSNTAFTSTEAPEFRLIVESFDKTTQMVTVRSNGKRCTTPIH